MDPKNLQQSSPQQTGPSQPPQQSGPSQARTSLLAPPPTIEILERVLSEAYFVMGRKLAFTVAPSAPVAALMAKIGFDKLVATITAIGDDVKRSDAAQTVNRAAEHLGVTSYTIAAAEQPDAARMRKQLDRVRAELLYENLCGLLLRVQAALTGQDAKVALAKAATALTDYGTTFLTSDAKTMRTLMRATAMSPDTPTARSVADAFAIGRARVPHLLTNLCANAAGVLDILKTSQPEAGLRYLKGLGFVFVKDAKGEEELAISKLLPEVPEAAWPMIFKMLWQSDRLESPVIARITGSRSDDDSRPMHVLLLCSAARAITTITWSWHDAPSLGVLKPTRETRSAFGAVMAAVADFEMVGIRDVVLYVKDAEKAPTFLDCLSAAVEVHDTKRTPIQIYLRYRELWGPPTFIGQKHTAEPLHSITIGDHIGRLIGSAAWKEYGPMLKQSKERGDTELIVHFDLAVTGTNRKTAGSALVVSGKSRSITHLEGWPLRTAFKNWFKHEAHKNDGEAVAISALAAMIDAYDKKKQGVTGRITFLQSQGPCESCRVMTHVFRTLYPGIDIVVIYPRIGINLPCQIPFCECSSVYGYHGMVVETDRIRNQDMSADTIVVSKKTIGTRRHWYVALPAGGAMPAPALPMPPAQVPPPHQMFVPQTPYWSYPQMYPPQYSGTQYPSSPQYPQQYPGPSYYPQQYSGGGYYSQYSPSYYPTYPQGSLPPPPSTAPTEALPPLVPQSTVDVDSILAKARLAWKLDQQDEELIRAAVPRLDPNRYKIVLGSIDEQNSKDQWLIVLKGLANLSM